MPAAELGTTLIHEHVFVGHPELDLNLPHPEWREDDAIETAVAGFERLWALGVRTVVDLTVPGLGRDVARVGRVAERTRVQLVASTGLLHAPTCCRRTSTPTGRAGWSAGRIPCSSSSSATSRKGIAGTERAGGHAQGRHGSSRASRPTYAGSWRPRRPRTGGPVCPITTHTHAPSRNGRDQLRFFLERGVSPDRLVIGHCGDSEDLDYLRELMDAGATIGMDRFGMEHVLPDDARLSTVLTLLQGGYADRMVLSQDAAFFSRVTPPSWRAAHAPHWTMENIAPADPPAAPRTAARPTTRSTSCWSSTRPGSCRPRRRASEERPLVRTSIATVCLSGTLVEKLHACAAAGFDGVEVFEPDLVASPASPEEVVALAGRLGLSLDLYQPFRDAEGVTDDEFESVLHRARAKFQLMQRLGIDTMLVCSNVGTATIDDDAVSAAQLRRLGEEAEGHGVRLAYEALAWGRFVDDYRRAWRIVELADHPAVGVCLDSFHILSRGHDPAEIEQIPGDRIFFLQLADAPALTMDVLSWSRHYRLFPGEGAFDLRAFVGHVLAAGYTGPLSLEVFNDVFRQTDVRRTARPGQALTDLAGGPGRAPRGLRGSCRPAHPAARHRATRRVRLRGGQGRGHRGDRRPPAPARLHLPGPPPHQAGATVDPGTGPGRVQRGTGP